MSGKKKVKAKWKSLPVQNVLGDNTVGVSKPMSGRGHPDDDHVNASRKPVLPTAPRAVRGSDDERVPKEPPFLAYLSNLPYEITEEEITEHFNDLKIVNVRLPRRETNSRGFGYVEFEERTGLLEALSKADLYLKGRTIRIDVAQETDRRMGRDRMDGRDRDRGDRDRDRDRDRDDDPDRTLGDWRSAPRPEPSGGEDRGGRSGRGYGGGFREEREGGGGGFGNRDADSREGGWRDSSASDRLPPARERFSDRRGFGDRDRDRGGGGFGDRDREFDRERRGYGGDRDRDRDYGPRKNYDDDRDRYPRRDDDGPPPSSEVRTRPKFVLEPRTVPLDPPPVPAPAESQPEAAPPAPRTSIFGDAKPVNTAAREREIEERLAKQRGVAPPRARTPERRSDDPPPKEDRPKDDRQEERSNDERPKDEQPKRVDAPPPKENAWSRRQVGATDNGVSNQDGEHVRSSSAHGSHDGDDRNESYRDSNSNRGDYRSTDSYRNSEGGRGGYRDSDNYGDSDRSRSGYRERDDDGRAGYRDSSRGSREPYRDSERGRDRDGGRDRNRDGDRDGDRGRDRGDRSGYRSGERGYGCRESRDNRSNHSSSERGRSYKDGDSSGKDDRPPTSDRPPRSRDRDDPSRMPKYKEADAPNFAASNKFSNLPDEGENY